MQSVFPLCENPIGEYSSAISPPWYEPKRAAVCNQSAHYASTLKINTALQSVFLCMKPKREELTQSFKVRTLKGSAPRHRPVLQGTNPKWDCPPTPAFWYDRSVLGFSFACGLRPHAKPNPKTPLACALLGQGHSLGPLATSRHQRSVMTVPSSSLA